MGINARHPGHDGYYLVVFPDYLPVYLDVDKECGKVPIRQDTLKRLDAFEEEQRQAKPMPFWEVALMLPVVVFYAAARA